MKYLKYKFNNKAGFTLIEMLVAVLIFSLSLAALMNIASRGLRVAKNAEKDVTADYLAMEGIEITRNLRDNALLRNLDYDWSSIFSGGEDWNEDEGCIYSEGQTPTPCRFSVNNNGQPILNACPAIGCDVYYNTQQHFYTQKTEGTSGLYKDSGFDRQITIQKQSEDEVVVDVLVTWDGGEIRYSENLFLWQ